MTHTKTPWEVCHDGLSICEPDGHLLSTQVEGLTEKEARANAAFIVRAANCHDELVAALQTLVDALPEDGEWGHFLDIKQAAIAALAKAKP